MKTRRTIHLCRWRPSVRKYPVKHFNKLEHTHFNPCFFEQLARHALLERFSKFQRPSGNGPFATKRLTAAADKQCAAILNNYTADTDDGTLGKFAGGSHFRKSALERSTIETAATRKS